MDNLKNNFPKNFRDLKSLNLNIIASAQFSENQLISVRKTYSNEDIIIVDLRLEDIELSQDDLDNIEINYLKFYSNMEHIIMPTIEKIIAKKYNFSYIGFPIKDYSNPGNFELQRIINFINNLLPTQKIYVHCAKGIGRTANFLVIYDILKNSKNISFDEILDRHYSHSGVDFRTVNAESKWDKKLADAKLNLLKDLFEKFK
jgi:protein tyrosine/serine phosphatase